MRGIDRVCYLISFGLMVVLFAGPAAMETTGAEVRFQTAEVFLNSGPEALAAYQVEIQYQNRKIEIVGLEGGEAQGFREPPYYDPTGLKSGRIIIAAFSSNDGKSPKGQIRVARLHLQITGLEPPVLEINLMTAAKPGGARIEAIPSIVLVNVQPLPAAGARPRRNNN